jgi:hypothetical protein
MPNLSIRFTKKKVFLAFYCLTLLIPERGSAGLPGEATEIWQIHGLLSIYYELFTSHKLFTEILHLIVRQLPIMIRRILLFLAVLPLYPIQAAAPRGCIASMSLGSFILEVVPNEKEKARPIAQVNLIRSGDKILYRPVNLPASFKKSAKVSLVQAPHGDQAKLSVSDPQPANQPAEWTAPFRVAVISIVFGPNGLNRKKITSMINKDQEIIGQLADYADKTEKVESLIQTLGAIEQSPSAGRNLDAALNGFAAQYNTTVPKLDRTAPADQQASALLKALNPALSSYDPLAPDPGHRLQQSAGLATSVASLFFGSSVGLATGGIAIFQNFRTALFPEMDFRSALAQQEASDTFTLCAKREAAKSHTRTAYLWARRLPDSDPPSIVLPEAAHVPLGAKTTLAVHLEKGSAEWKLAGRVRDWTLVSADKQKFPVSVQTGAQSQEIVLDLTNATAPPGDYHLEAKWDWDVLNISGVLHLHKLSDLKTVRVLPESTDLLIQGVGPVDVRLLGPDLEFVERVTLDQQALEFYLPTGRSGGPQNTLDVVLDTRKIAAGQYYLTLYQPDGSSCSLPLRILPPNPQIGNLPLRTNVGETSQTLVLHGTGISRIEKMEAAGVQLDLGPAAGDTRNLQIRLESGAKPGDRIPLSLKVEGLNRWLNLQGALEVLGPRPHIASISVSLPDDLGMEVRPGELPAGSFASFSIQADSIDARPMLHVECANSLLSTQAVTLRPGEKKGLAKLDRAGSNLLFLSFDPGAIGQPDCTLEATVASDTVGVSDTHKLGRVIRLPRIDSFELTNEKIGPSAYRGILTGQDLEIIEKTGWEPETGLPVSELPRPVAGQGQKQSLKVALPWPSPGPHSALYIWLRGEPRGRITKAKN